MNEPLEDRHLMLLITKQDASALEQLYDRYERVVYSFAYRLVNDPMAAEEVVQELFMRIWNHAERYDANHGKLSTWMFTITRNIAIDMLRRQKSAPTAASSMEDVLIHDIADQQKSTEQEIESKWLGIKVKEALAELSHEQQVIINSIYFRGMTQHEVAESYNIPLGTVKSRVRLAMKQLQKRLYNLDLLPDVERREGVHE